jgi:hypothetical protein
MSAITENKPVSKLLLWGKKINFSSAVQFYLGQKRLVLSWVIIEQPINRMIDTTLKLIYNLILCAYIKWCI